MKKFNTSTLLISTSADNSKALVIEFLHEKIDKNINIENNPNLTWVNTEDETLKIADVKNLIQKLSYTSYQDKPRFFVIFNLDQATIAAQNALLKITEEPPKNTQLIITATDLNRVLPTIQSRCRVITEENSANLNQMDLHPLLKELLTQPHKVSFSELIDLAQKNKDRQKAESFIYSQMIALENASNETFNSRRILSAKKLLLATHQQLRQNINVQLSLENCLFELKKFEK